MKTIKSTLTYANVMATFAVFLVLGGTAFAVTQVKKNSVSSKSIKDAAVTGRDVKNSSITGADVRDDSVTGADVDEGTLTLPADQTAPTGPAGGDLTGTFPNPTIGPDGVGTAEIADGGVTNADIAQGAVTGIKLGLSSVDSSKIQDDSVGSPEIADNAVSSSEINGAAVGPDELKGAFTVTTPGVVVTTAGARGDTANCPSGSRALAGGYSWQDTEANSMIANQPSQTNPNRGWTATGIVDAGTNVLFVWALCI